MTLVGMQNLCGGDGEPFRVIIGGKLPQLKSSFVHYADLSMNWLEE